MPRDARLRQIITERSFKEGTFTLASGKTSNVFFDLKQTMLTHEGLNLIADGVLARIKDVEARAIGGLAMGAVPILIAAVLYSDRLGRPLDGFWVRKEQKDHGARSLIDGPLEPGSRVIIVDDVTTTGESALKAVRAVRALNCEVACVLTVIDRCEGAVEAVRAEGLDLVALFNRYDFTDKGPEDA